jgi:hypothetical protein
MHFFKKIRSGIVLSWAFVFILLTIFSFVAVGAKEEGTGHGLLINILSAPYGIFRFPIHTFFLDLFENSFLFPIIFFGGWVVNSLLYGLLFERLTLFLRR